MTSTESSLLGGRYRLLTRLGGGGMGEVFRAHDTRLRRDVALKFLALDTGEADARRRLLREARAAAFLDHPNICTVYEVGETGEGKAFIAMQLVDGETLAEMLRRGPLPVATALALCADVAEALAVAHGKGIVHRDLKPQNIMVTPSGRAKLLDFGIADVQLGIVPPDVSTHSVETVAGGLPGTPAYIAPERIQQRPADARSDLFSLGAVLYECLTGLRAFGGSSTVEIFGQVLHVDPPPPSRVRSEIPSSCDTLCARLLAKRPEDRFQSAADVAHVLHALASGGETVAGLLQDSSKRRASPDLRDRPPAAGAGEQRRTLRQAVLPALVIAVAALAVAGYLQWQRESPLPVPPPEAQRWYERGTDAIREGAYQSGSVALDEAIALFPEFVLAYARQAEALAELDDERGAQVRLLKVASLVPDETRLPELERLRLQGIRALVLRDLDGSLAAYRAITRLRERDASAWVDLGRVQEAAGLRAEARRSFTRAIEIDPQFAAGHLRLARVEAAEVRREAALAAFAEAERLYRTASNQEGEAEVLLRRGSFFDALGELSSARRDLERALALIKPSDNLRQSVQLRLALSSVTASEGRFSESESLAADAVQDALTGGLQSFAAEGLIGLAGALLQLGRFEDARAQLRRAIALAEERGARRIRAWGQLQAGALELAARRPRPALELAQQAGDYFRKYRYRRFELIALTVSARAHEFLNDLDTAERLSTDALRIAETISDDAQVALALQTLASLAQKRGEWPRALELLECGETIHRRQADMAMLAYQLVERADLLLRMGQSGAARKALDEVERGIDQGLDAFLALRSDLAFVRGLDALIQSRFEDARANLASVPHNESQRSLEAADLLAFVDASLRRAVEPPSLGGSDLPGRRAERIYWHARALIVGGQARRAADLAQDALDLADVPANDEREWRLAAAGALAASRIGDARRTDALLERAREAYQRLRAGWGSAFEAYTARSDLAPLIDLLSRRPSK